MIRAHRAIATLGAALTLAAAAVAAAMPAQATTTAGSGPYYNPAIAWTGTAEVITATDSSGNLDYWWQAAGTAAWHEQQVAAGSGGVTYSNPAIAWTGTAEVITATDSSGNLDYWWQAAGTAAWHEQQVAAGGPTVLYQDPAIAWTGTAEVITSGDSNSGVDYWWQAAGTAPWHEQQVAPGCSPCSIETGAVGYHSPSIAWTGTAEVITAPDTSGNLDYWWQAAGTGTWNEQQVAAATLGNYQHPSIAWTGTAEVITAAGGNGNLYYWWQAAGTAPWHEQEVAAVGAVTSYQNPSVAWTGTAEVITATDSGGNLDYWWQAAGTAAWNQQQVAAASSGLTYANAAIAWTGTAEVITATDSGGNLDYWWQAAGTAPWNPQVAAPVAAGGAPWGDATELPGIAALNTGAYAVVTSVSCPSAGNCAAGGYYTDSSRNAQAFVADEANGTWDTASEVPGTAGLNVGSTAKVTSVSCASAGNCVAGGYYSDSTTTAGTQTFVADEANGVWGDASEVPGTIALNVGDSAEVTSVSCPAAGNCTVGGYYSDNSTTTTGTQTFVADEANGVWGDASEVPGSAALNADDFAQVTSVSCSSAGNCAAGGWYDVSTGNGLAASEAFVASETGSVWGDAVEVPGTAALNTGDYAQVTSVSCSSTGNCAAGGWYATGTQTAPSDQLLLVSEVNGIWGSATAIGAGQVNSVSCPSAGNCTAGGPGFVTDEVSGTWGGPDPLSGIPAGVTGTVSSVSCASAGNCVAGGEYTGGIALDYAHVPFVLSEVDGTWGAAIEVPGLPSTGAAAQVSSVSCPSAGNCTAGGEYDDVSNNGHAFVVSQN